MSPDTANGALGPSSVLRPEELNELASLLEQLIAIPSVTPWIDASSHGEATVAQAIQKWFGKVPGVRFWEEEAAPGRPNVLVELAGRGNGKALCLLAHTDTVGYSAWAQTALRARREHNRIIGLGAADNKGQCAALMMALRALARSGEPLQGGLVGAFVVDEEGQSLGAHHFVDHHHPDAAIVLEPIGVGKCCITHQGFGSLDLKVQGRAAHGLDYQNAVDAIARTARIITELVRLDREKYAAHPHALNGKTMFHTSMIAGGTDYGTYPADCTLGFEVGTQPGERLEDRIAEINKAIGQVRANTYPDLQAEISIRLENQPFEARGHEQIWSAFASATQRITGAQLAATGWGPWADSAITQAAGIPTLLCGAEGGNLHAPEEWASLDELFLLARLLADCAKSYCA
jgi:acetylornithine deacetylase/succinyl-diaminopimelate desuccinylase-like protein